jgi:SpoVK/Ycf46/Vps4 family AAA+-type ATPase
MDATKSMKYRTRHEQQAAWVFLRFLLHRADTERMVSEVGMDRTFQHWVFGHPVPKSSMRIILNQCRALYRTLQAQFDESPFYPEPVREVADRFGLNETERRIVWLAVLHYECSSFREVLRSLQSDLTRCTEAGHMIARLIDAHTADVIPAIGLRGHLVEIGLLEPVLHYTDIDDYLNISHRVLSGFTGELSLDKAMEMFLRPARPAAMLPEDFPHLQNDLAHVRRYLRSVLLHKTRGVNVLLYGMPGTGKTEFARLVAQILSVPLYVVPEDHEERYSERNQSRLSAYRMTQALLSSTSALILFDDVEDGILDWADVTWAPKTSGKAMLNTLLESNPVPALWITNVASRFDHAHLRRFDLAVGFKTPPRSVRVSMIDKHLNDLPLSKSFKSCLADDRSLTPAQIGKIARVVGSISHNETQAVDLEPLANHLYRAAYKLRFGRAPDPDQKDSKSVEFDPDWVNSSLPTLQIIDMFRQTTRVTACFHGLPGTGKTALAQHIAQVLDKPLLVKRASDLLRPFLGETEMLLREMFEEAMDEDAVLLLDEADSFLSDRTGAQRIWEVTQVNELLTQIERFHGYFIATTNAFDVLDLASLRRFDLKVCFQPLLPDQRLRRFDALLKQFGIASEVNSIPSSSEIVTALQSMTQLTSGDFAVVARRLSVIRIQLNTGLVLDALSAEHHYKQHLGRSIGFVA